MDRPVTARPAPATASTAATASSAATALAAARELLRVLTALGALAASVALLAVVAGCGSSEAEAGAGDLLPWFQTELATMVGYDVDPATFDRYARRSHAEAFAAAFPPGTPPDDLKAKADYAAEVHRGMLDLAFSDGRTDLADILTRAYLAAQRAR